jgi:hypothetical protein
MGAGAGFRASLTVVLDRVCRQKPLTLLSPVDTDLNALPSSIGPKFF